MYISSLGSFLYWTLIYLRLIISIPTSLSVVYYYIELQTPLPDDDFELLVELCLPHPFWKMVLGYLGVSFFSSSSWNDSTGNKKDVIIYCYYVGEDSKLSI